MPLASCHDVTMILMLMPVHLSIADTFRKGMCNFEVNPGNGSRVIAIFIPVPQFHTTVTNSYECSQCLHHQNLALVLELLFRLQWMCPCWPVIGMYQIRCENFDCSSINPTFWKKICQTISVEVDYLLSILGKEGYAAMDCWMSTDPADKNYAGKFLDYLKNTLDDEISPCVRVYELEDVKKRTDETIDALIDCIQQFAHHVLMGDGSDTAAEFEVQCRLIHAIPGGEIELWKEHLKVSWDKGVSHPLEICHTYYAVESGAAAMCAGKTINAVQKSHQPQNQPQKYSSQYHNCTCQHPPRHDNCPAWDSICKGCWKKGHWQAKCHSSKKN